jgi:Tol biopolymer transport system component
MNEPGILVNSAAPQRRCSVVPIEPSGPLSPSVFFLNTANEGGKIGGIFGAREGGYLEGEHTARLRKPVGPPVTPDIGAASERLDSWKEIAAYLKRDVRTVHRWENIEGLPVHRHPHQKRGSVYAFKAELDAWWVDGHSRLELQPESALHWKQAASLEGQVPAIPVGRKHQANRRLVWLSLAGIVLVAATCVAWWQLIRPSANAPLALTQLTTDIGLTYQPALSPDAKLVAYASDRSGNGNLDIWVQQVPRGEPIRVTHHEADDYEPSFSPDGRTLIFRSDRAGGGIYVVPALGGEVRKIADQGRQPHYSPDGRWIAYWVGPRRDKAGPIYVMPSVGGQPRQLTPEECAVARSPIWTPDGKHLLFKALLGDWYVVPVDGGPVVKTGVEEAFRRHGFPVGTEVPPLLYPQVWLAIGNSVVFSGKTGDSTDLWRISISPKTWQVASEPQRLTVGSGLHYYASASADGRLVFSSLARNANIWSLPMDANRGKVTGEMKQQTHDAADDLSPSISADGKHMGFESNRTGKRVVWTKDLETGKEKALTDTPSSENLPIISADGTEVLYFITHWPDEDGELYMTPFEGGPAKKVCNACKQPFQWSSDKSHILVEGSDDGDPRALLAWLDVATGQKVKLLRHPKYPIWSGHLSPDESWIGFLAEFPHGQFRAFLAPLKNGAGPPENTWIPALDNWWSPDGNWLYGFDERDGFSCLYSQRLDPKTKQPAGPPQPVHHFHTARRSVIEDPAWRGGSVARDKIVITVVELTGNIWMAEQQKNERVQHTRP